MSLWKVARERGIQIARELGIRKASELYKPYVYRLFDRALADMARTPEASAKHRLRRQSEKIGNRRDLQTAAVLLELSWRVPSRSKLEEDIVLVIGKCYLDEPKDHWRLLIRDELCDRQFHPFPSVRRIACLVRHVDRVESVELAEIRQIERGYPDLRTSIAERIVMFSQVEHLEAVISYLSKVLPNLGVDAEERKAAKQIFQQLAGSFTRSERALAILYRTYVSSYEHEELRGFLQLALVGYGDSIVPQLAYDHDETRGDRPAIEHLLAKMVARGSVSATRGLIDILKDAQPREVGRICKFFWDGLQTLAVYAETNSGATAVGEEIRETLPQFERRREPALLRFVQDFSGLEWGMPNVESLVQNVLDGTLTDTHRKQIRRAARTVVRQLVAAAADASSDLKQRRRALDAIATFRSTGSQPMLGVQLWTIFCVAESDDVRIGVLQALSALELDPGPEARKDLYERIGSGSVKLAGAIRRAWSGMFRAVGLNDFSPPKGGRR